MDTGTIIFAFGLTLFAGLSTGIGSAFAFFSKKTNTKFLAISLGFSAGVMLYVSFVEILVKARESMVEFYGKGASAESVASWYTAGAFFFGIALIAVIDKLVPSYENPHELHRVEDMENADMEKKLLRMGIFSAIAIAIHNFPEGLATFTAAMKDPQIGISIAIAIAIHNIPEGIAVSVPVYYATGNRKKAFVYSFLSGLAEPVGAALGFIFLMTFFNGLTFGIVFAMVAGIMVFISLDELLPTAEEFGEHHSAIYGLISGMAVMALSLLLF